MNEHHYLLREDLEAILDAAGFDVEGVYGSFERGPFNAEESDHLIYATRRRVNT